MIQQARSVQPVPPRLARCPRPRRRARLWRAARLAALLLAAPAAGVGPALADSVTPGPPSFGYAQGWLHYKTGAPEAAEAVWHRLAQRGDPWAQYGMGLLHDPLKGTAGPETATVAERWYLKAADQALPQAQDKLAQLYASGAGPVARDPARAVLLWQTAAQRGYAPAVDHLIAFKVAQAQAVGPDADGETAPVSRTVAVEDLRAAVEAAGYFASRGTSGDGNRARATSWYQLAAELGDADARRQLRDRGEPSPPAEPDAGSEPTAARQPPPAAENGATPTPSAQQPTQARRRQTSGPRRMTGEQTGPRSYILQLGSLLSQEDAEREQIRMHRLFPQTLADLDTEITHHGQYYRIRTEMRLSLSHAGDRCRRIRAAGQACMILKRP